MLAGLIHALWNIAAKKAGGDARFACFTAGVGLVAWAPVAVWLGWDVLQQWGWWEWAFVFVSGVLHVLYFVVLLRGYRHADLTVVYPLARGTGPLLSSLVALLWLGESMSLFGALGVVGVVGGVFLIAGGPKLVTEWRRTDDLSEAQLAAQQLRRAGVRYGLLTGGVIACYTVVDGYAVKVLLMSSRVPGWATMRLSLAAAELSPRSTWISCEPLSTWMYVASLSEACKAYGSSVMPPVPEIA